MSTPMTGVRAIVLCVASAASCGGDPDPAPSTPDPPARCDAPNRRVDGRCLEPGVQDDGCSAGTLRRDDASCAPAGVLPELCPEGFQPSNGGCEPVLPPEPCAEGQMAIPGEVSCHEPMPCGRGRWGNAPIDAMTTFVDAAYAGADSDGSEDKPWKTINEAVQSASPDAVIAIAAGTYAEQVVLSKRLRLWGRCPAEVEVVGAPNAVSMAFLDDSGGSELHGITLRAGLIAVLVQGVKDITLDGLRIHGTEFNAVQVNDAGGDGGATMTRSLVEGCREVGVFVVSSDLTVDSSVIRGTMLTSDGKRGVAVAVQNAEDGSESGSLALRRVLIEQNHGGVLSSGAHLEVEAAVIRDTQMNGAGRHGRGIQVQAGYGGAQGSAIITGSVLERNHSAGVYVLGARATLEGVTVRDTQAAADFGAGVIAWDHHPSGMPSADLTLRWSLLERNLALGLIVSGSSALVEGVRVRDTFDDEDVYPAGIWIQGDWETGTPATAALRGVDVLASPQIGISVFDAEVTIEGAHVDATRSDPSDATWGDAVSVFSSSALPVRMSGSLLENSARSGLSVWGGPLEIATSRFACNAIALDAEPLVGVEAGMTDAGGNACGCADLGPCQAVSSSLQPPAALPAQEQ